MVLELVSINMNNRCQVVLNQYGLNILQKHRDKFNLDDRHYKVESDNSLTTELWVIMQIFGDHFYMGCQVPFEKNEIRLQLK